jgi:hypothetical protein
VRLFIDFSPASAGLSFFGVLFFPEGVELILAGRSDIVEVGGG